MRRVMSLLALMGMSGSVFADAPAAGQQTGGFASMLPLFVIMLVVFLLFMLPQMRRNKQQKTMLSNLAKGDEVLTTSGMLARIERIGDSYLEVAIADKVNIKIQKQAVVSVVPKGTMESV